MIWLWLGAALLFIGILTLVFMALIAFFEDD